MAEQGTAARLIEVATAELGTIEGPKDNETKYGAYTKSNFQPWCGSFINWCGNEAGVKIPTGYSAFIPWAGLPCALDTSLGADFALITHAALDIAVAR